MKSMMLTCVLLFIATSVSVFYFSMRSDWKPTNWVWAAFITDRSIPSAITCKNHCGDVNSFFLFFVESPLYYPMFRTTTSVKKIWLLSKGWLLWATSPAALGYNIEVDLEWWFFNTGNAHYAYKLYALGWKKGWLSCARQWASIAFIAYTEPKMYSMVILRRRPVQDSFRTLGMCNI